MRAVSVRVQYNSGLRLSLMAPVFMSHLSQQLTFTIFSPVLPTRYSALPALFIREQVELGRFAIHL